MHIDITQLQDEQFAHSYHWEVSFPDYSGAFFPATIMQDGWFKFENEEEQTGGGNLAFPKAAAYGDRYSVQIYETHDYKIFKWLNEWKLALSADGFSVSLIGNNNVARTMIIYLNNWQKTDKITKTILVIPEGEVSADLSSDKGGTMDISVSFVHVGETSIVTA